MDILNGQSHMSSEPSYHGKVTDFWLYDNVWHLVRPNFTQGIRSRIRSTYQAFADSKFNQFASESGDGMLDVQIKLIWGQER
jgi:hypothetical protein